MMPDHCSCSRWTRFRSPIESAMLLMGAAYFIGAALACLIRRSLFAPAAYSTAERRVDPLPVASLASRAAVRPPSGVLPAPSPAKSEQR
jgi:hypothetical protein